MGAGISWPCLSRSARAEAPNFVIIVPFRNIGDSSWSARLERLTAHFEVALPPGGRLLVVEQSCDGQPFNRGQLLNAGFLACFEQAWMRPDVVVLHDLSMLPDQATLNLYAYQGETRVRAFAAAHGKYKTDGCFGGVLALCPAAFEAANGFPNNLPGCGCENSALQTRLKKAEMSWTHSFGEFESNLQRFDSQRDPMVAVGDLPKGQMTSKEKRQHLTTDKRRWREDGLSTVQYSAVTSRSMERNGSVWCVHLVVELDSNGVRCGRCQKWQPVSFYSNRQANQRGPANKTVCKSCLSDEYSVVETRVKQNADEARRSCEECGKVFSTRSQLFNHLPKCGQETDESPPLVACRPCKLADKSGLSPQGWIKAFAAKIIRAASSLSTGDACSVAEGSETLLRRLLAAQKVSCQSRHTHIAQMQSLLARVTDLVGAADGDETSVLDLGAGKALFTRALYESFGRRVPVIALDVLDLRDSRKDSFFDPAEVRLGEAPYTRIVTDLRTPQWVEGPELKGPIVAVTKHLCGGATDAALVQVCQLQLKGLCMAPCCHQKLNLTEYCNKAYLEEIGFATARDFRWLLKLLQISCHKTLKEFEYRNHAILQALPFEEVKQLGSRRRFALSALRGAGVDTTLVEEVTDGSGLPSSLVVLSQDTGSRTIISSRRGLREMDPEHFGVALEQARLEVPTKGELCWCHLECRQMPGVQRMAEILRPAGLSSPGLPVLSVEVEKPSLEPAQLVALLRICDVALFSSAFIEARAAELSEPKDEQEAGEQQPMPSSSDNGSWKGHIALQSLRSYSSKVGCRRALWVCPWGALGAFALDTATGEAFFEPARAAGEVVDTLGAGDTFNAACLHALALGATAQEALRSACTVAGKKVSQHGIAGLGSSVPSDMPWLQQAP
ncbi:unnamed protein product [Polarella glacialis]|uniref:tRNA:m(4)X modification enzyme TRM13 n=1 Tax=Polarella glacialis TaxID=89957 RepID=A0A813L2D6_POLGL|nr:unnamed protein product [Polarella glacialis]